MKEADIPMKLEKRKEKNSQVEEIQTIIIVKLFKLMKMT